MTQHVPTENEVLSYFEALSNWGRWGPDDELGTLNLVTPAKRIAAAELVRVGTTVSCAWDVGGAPPADQPMGPPRRYMLATGQGLADEHRVTAPGREGDRSAGAAEYIGLVYHGHTVTHVDGLSHIFWDGRMYNGKPAELVTTTFGATEHDITALRHGVVTRGVLLDVAGARGGDWLEPGEAVFPSDLEAAEEREGVRVDEGDVLLLRTGYGRKVRDEGPDEVARVGRAGWHAACLPWLHERGVAMIACDTAQDAIPSGYAGLRNPIHAVGIVAMGLWLLDNCDLEALAQACEGFGRWEFLFTLAPLRWVGATGSPANPIATF
ncbi:MAG: cyclase family protein [Actinomycetota bacterium]